MQGLEYGSVPVTPPVIPTAYLFTVAMAMDQSDGNDMCGSKNVELWNRNRALYYYHTVPI